MSDSSSVDGFVPWVLAGIASMIATLASAVAALTKTRFAEYSKEITELKTRSDACEKDRSELFAKTARLEEKVEHLQSKLSMIDANGTRHSQLEKQ
jgi:septal ring factor EnvC (AmiA/AmiB activator)